MPPQYDAIFIMGPQGSGKGTQAKLLATKLGLFYWEMGGVLRSERAHRFASGETVGEIIDKGILLPDEQLLEVFRSHVSQIPPDKGIIFDGIPRRIGQAQYVVDYLKQLGKKKFLTLFINVPREVSLKRLLARAAIEKREDDTEEGIQNRLRYYEEATFPILDYMKKETKFIEIDGRPAIPEVTKEIDQTLGLA